MSMAGPSRPRSLPPIDLSDDEDDFDGIEDIIPTQPKVYATDRADKTRQEKVTLDDLFYDISDGAKDAEHEDEVDQEYAKAFGQSDGQSPPLSRVPAFGRADRSRPSRAR